MLSYVEDQGNFLVDNLGMCHGQEDCLLAMNHKISEPSVGLHVLYKDVEHLIKEHVILLQDSLLLPSTFHPCSCCQHQVEGVSIFGGSFPGGFPIFPKYVKPVPIPDPSRQPRTL